MNLKKQSAVPNDSNSEPHVSDVTLVQDSKINDAESGLIQSDSLKSKSNNLPSNIDVLGSKDKSYESVKYDEYGLVPYDGVDLIQSDDREDDSNNNIVVATGSTSYSVIEGLLIHPPMLKKSIILS